MESSSKYYKELPCVIAKSLIAKYQKNKKCKQVSNLVLPVCGDKGKQIKLEDRGIRIPALFKKEVLPVHWLRWPVGFVRSAEFFERSGEWYTAICYNAKAEKPFSVTGTVGVDRNSVGAVATLADPQNGKVLHLGFNPARTKAVWRGQKANLQSLGKRRLLHKIRNKQSRRTRYENHVVSKQIVDYAAKHRRCIVLEKLENVRKGKIRRYVAGFPACICRALVYNPRLEANHEPALFFAPVCLFARRHALGRRRSFLREMETQHGEKQVHR
jgi:transposase